jgi:Ca2+-binding EF-hand superfamily protein
VLDVLDSDKDLIISPWENFTAPAALRRLDTNHDGKLSAEECGFFIGPNTRMPPDAVARARLAFMRDNPVLEALDADHDGEISAAEIDNSSHALQKLDRNGDGSLTPDELIPDQQSSQAAIILFRLDTNGDGSLSRAEWSDEDGALRELLQSADRNHDGVVTRVELKNELALRSERKREIEGARRAAGIQ